MVEVSPSGWDSLATKADLRVLAAELRAEMAGLASELRKEMRDQTRWLTGVLVVTMTLFTGVFAGISQL